MTAPTFIRLTRVGSHAGPRGVPFYVNADRIVTLQRDGDATALWIDCELGLISVAETPAEVLALIGAGVTG